MENVPGLVTGKMKLIFCRMMEELRTAGYEVSARVLNAMYYGVPQARRRLIVVGVRKDLAARGILPSHPVGSERVMTFREAVKGLPVETTAKLKGLALDLWKETKPDGRSRTSIPKATGSMP